MRPPLLLLAGLLLVAACSGGAGDSGTTIPPTSVDESTTAATTPPTEPPTTTSRPTPTTPATLAPTTSTTLADSRVTTTTTSTSTTSTTSTSSTTSTTSSTTTTTAPPAGANRRPVIRITSPAGLADLRAEFDEDRGAFAAEIVLAVEVSDPDGDAVRVEWFSSSDGALGEGAELNAVLTTQQSAISTFITAVAIDARGAIAVAVTEALIRVPSE